MGQIKVEKNAGGIEGLCVIEPAVHGDARGYFMETYNQKRYGRGGAYHAVCPGQSVLFFQRCFERASFPERVSPGKTCQMIKGRCL